ncbi:MAG TPA: DUF1552 domain-containing protein [Polyangiaceae bacterium]
MITRRRLLASAGVAGSALALFPWLERRASAQTLPPRLLLYYTPHGTVWDRYRPSGGETDFELSPILTPLADHRDRLVITDGLEMECGTEYYIPHTYTMPVLWTGSPIDTASSTFCRDDHGQCFGWGTGTSVDQEIARRLAPATPFSTIELGYQCGNLHPAKRMIYSSSGTTKNPLDDPARAFEQLFGGDVDLGEEEAARAALKRQSVLDAALGDFNSRRGSLSAADRLRLDAHADSIRELERSLGGGGGACTKPAAPADITAETAIDRQSDLIAGIFGCGLTRIASFQLRIADNDNSLYPWLGLDEGGHHTLSHENDSATLATLAELYTWYSKRFAYLLDRLAATPDVDGTSVLDNTLVIWGSELGVGWSHSLDNVPFVFAGGASGRLRGGRYLKFSNTYTNRVLVTAMHAMGFTDVEQYGSTDTGSGPLSGVLT